MCGCARPRPVARGSRGVIVTRNAAPPVRSSPNPAPPNTLTLTQAMDPERLRIEQLKREAIRRTFGGTA